MAWENGMHAVHPIRCRFVTALIYASCLVVFNCLTTDRIAAFGWDDTPILQRNVDVLRYGAADSPTSEGEQELYLDWPIYRTARGQAAFNAAMAMLRATDGKPPPRAAFSGCRRLRCPLGLPTIPSSGWIPGGRLWMSPKAFILFVHARRRPAAQVKRRSRKSMRYFVFHEFHNSTGNIDPYDTVSSHNRRVFVPFYMSKTQSDAKGRRFVVIIQVAPFDVRSIHASNFGSAGPGIEVAKNRYERLEALQAQAGIMIATMIKRRVPSLRVVNHRGSEGRPMLNAYRNRLKALRRRPAIRRIVLPFTSANKLQVARASGRLTQLVRWRGVPLWRDQFGSPARQVVAASWGLRTVTAPKLLKAPVVAKKPTTTVPGIAEAPITAFLLASPGISSLLSPPKRARPPWCLGPPAVFWNVSCRRR